MSIDAALERKIGTIQATIYNQVLWSVAKQVSEEIFYEIRTALLGKVCNESCDGITDFQNMHTLK